MKYCTHCGQELLDEAVICSGCGCLAVSEADYHVQEIISADKTNNMINQTNTEIVQDTTEKFTSVQKSYVKKNKRNYDEYIAFGILSVIVLLEVIFSLPSAHVTDIAGVYCDTGFYEYQLYDKSRTYTISSAFGNLIDGGTYTYKRGIVTFDDDTSGYIAKENVLIDEDYYRENSSKNKVTKSGSGISGKVEVGFADINFTDDGYCEYDGEMCRYTVNEQGFVYIEIDDEFDIEGYIYKGVFIPYDLNGSLLIKEDVLN